MLCGQTRARVFNGAAAVRSSSRFFARRSDGALRATTIIRLRPHMAGLRPAGSHCENSGSSDGSGASARSGRAKQRSLLCPLSERGWRHLLLFAVLDLLVLLDQAKSTRKNLREEKFPDRFFGKIPTFSSGISCKKIFTTFCHQKVAPKVSAGRKSRGTADGLRLKRYADKLAPAFSTAHPPPVLLPDFPQCGVCCALRATMILIPFTQF